MKKLIIPVAALLALGTACTSSGESDETTRDESGTIVESGDLGVFAIKVGDCFNDLGSFESEIEEVDGQSCATDHLYEVYHAFDIAGDDFPGDDAVVVSAQEGCLATFDSFVGKPYADSALDISYLYPTSDSWSVGDDREVLCMVVNVDQTPRSGSAAGVGV